MKDSSEKFLDIIHAYILSAPVVFSKVSIKEWEEIYHMAVKHKLEMAVYETIYPMEAFQSIPEEVKNEWKHEVKQGTVMEMRKTERFWEVYAALDKAGVHPLVLKGVVCRFLYAKPYARPSGDEDFFVSGQDLNKCCRVLEKLNLCRSQGGESNVLSFDDTVSALHLEVHRELFDESISTNKRFNSWFRKALESEYYVEADGHRLRTMEPGLHLLYLFAHWMKHFIGPGIGIRQICDISVFINHYGDGIDWGELWECIENAGYDMICANLLDIGIRYFALDRKRVHLPDEIFLHVDSQSLLEDMLEAGIYGSSSTSRLHSSSLTLDAMEGRKGKMHVLFPSARNLYGRYRFLRYCPWLLPFVWIHRGIHYGLEVMENKHGDNSPSESIAIGNSRVHLLKKYNVVK